MDAAELRLVEGPRAHIADTYKEEADAARAQARRDLDEENAAPARQDQRAAPAAGLSVSVLAAWRLTHIP
jgi:hypothetical protein